MAQLTMFGTPVAETPEGEEVIEDRDRFIRWMRDVARGISRSNGQVDADDLREYASNKGSSPRSPKWWGQIFRDEEIKDLRFVGWKKSRWPSNNARKIMVWRWKDD